VQGIILPPQRGKGDKNFKNPDNFGAGPRKIYLFKSPLGPGSYGFYFKNSLRLWGRGF